MKYRRALVLGHSHTQALKKALVERRKQFVQDKCSFEIYTLTTPSLKGDIKRPEAIELCAALSSDDVVILAIGGNRHSVIGLFQHSQPFYLTVDGFQPQEDMEMIPCNVVISDYENVFFENEAKVIAQFKKNSPCPVYQLESPPPKESAEYIRKSAERFFKSKLEASATVMPAPVRKKLWQTQEKVFKEMCFNAGVGFLLTPQDALSGSGFLSEECYMGANATHANEKYGELVLKQIENVVNKNLTVGK